MHGSGRMGHTYLTAAAALALLAGCSGGNKNNNSNNAANSAVTTAATAATRIATPVATARPATAAAAAQTPTPSAAAAASPTAPPAASAGDVARTPTPAAGAASSFAGSGPTDATLQKAITDAALQEADLPAGFVLQGQADTTVNVPGQTAGYTAAYVNLTKIPLIQAAAIVIGGFKDQQIATTDFATIEESVATEAGGDFQLTPEPNGPKLGDDAKSFRLSGTTSGISLGGYAIIWRRGKLTTVVILLGNPDVSSINDVTPLAQKQDDRLKAIPQ